MSVPDRVGAAAEPRRVVPPAAGHLCRSNSELLHVTADRRVVYDPEDSTRQLERLPPSLLTQ